MLTPEGKHYLTTNNIDSGYYSPAMSIIRTITALTI